MDDSTLRTFVGVARSGSFARYARQEALAPSSVSRAIDGLERELGARLFQRTTRKLALSDAGERLLRHVEPLLEQLAQVKSVARGGGADATDSLRMTAPVAFGQVVLAPLLVELMRAHPEIALQVVLSDQTFNLIEERFDLAVRFGKLHDSTLVARRLGKLSYAACASPRYLAQQGVPRQPADLVRHACLHHPILGRKPTWTFRAPSGAQSHVLARGPIAINNAVALRTFALAGLGIALVPRWNVREDLASGALVELFPKYEASVSDLEAGISLVTPTRKHVPRGVRVVSDFICARLRGARIGGRG